MTVSIGVAPGTLLGRRQEVSVIRDFLEHTSRTEGVLRLVGDPGIGKSALLDRAEALAADDGEWRVLRGSGFEYEAELTYAGLHQLMSPVAETLAEVPPQHRSVLGTALGMEDGPMPRQLVVATALLSWFEELCRRRPLLVIVDDLQWLDRASGLTLSLAARRLKGTGIALLTAQRAGTESFLDERTQTLTLAPLDDQDAARFVKLTSPHLHPSVRRRVIREAGGNPLALVELPRALTSDEEHAGDQLPVVLRLTDRLRAMYAARVEPLPRPTRHLLLLAALNGSDGVPLAPTVAAAATDLAAAEDRDLVRIDRREQRLTFRHPLTRAAIVELATPAERRAAHRHLASLTTDPALRAFHFGEAALGFDEGAATALQQAARLALAQGDVVQAVSRMIRAAELTVEPRERARRLAEAAYLGANFSGTLAGAHTLLERARQAAPDAANTLSTATAAAAHLLNSDGDIDTAHRMLVAALTHTDPGLADGTAVEAAITTLMAVCTFGGRAALWDAFEDTVARFAHVLPRSLVLGAQTFGDPARSSASALRELDALVDDVADDANPVRVLQVGLAGHYVDRLPRAAVERVVAGARTGGAIAAGVNGLILLAVDAYFSGRWTDAVHLADECIEWCRENGYPTLEWGALNVRMLIAAARGDRQLLHDAHDRMRQWALPRRALAVRTFTSNTDALVALADGQFGDAYAHLSSIAAPGQFPRHDQVSMWSILDLVEAAVGDGRLAEAKTHLAAAEELGLPRVSPRLRFLCLAAQAMVADDRDYKSAFERAIADPDAGTWPFYVARVELAFGDRLRRNREMRQARNHLERAHELFGLLEAVPWLDRAATSLRSTGRTSRRASTDVISTLTPQEHEIARLAAKGLTNRQIGSQLFLSPRTVGGHLYRVFPKLGISTRAALRDALTELDRATNADSSMTAGAYRVE